MFDFPLTFILSPFDRFRAVSEVEPPEGRGNIIPSPLVGEG
jgi:hypothetical protein